MDYYKGYLGSHILKPYDALVMGTGKRREIRISPLFLVCAMHGGVIYQDRGQRRKSKFA